jgi:hypothetical protein
VQSTSTGFQTGGLTSVLVGTDGQMIAETPLTQNMGAARFPAIAYGGGRYLVVYSEMNVGTVRGLLVAADGTAVGAPFEIASGSGDGAVAYGAGVFLVARVEKGSVWVTAVDAQGDVLGDSNPYPGETQASPAIATDGTNFLVAWQTVATDGSTHVAAGRVNAQGRAIDIDETRVSNGTGVEQEVDVAFDGTNYVLAWFQRPDPSLSDEGTIRVARIGANGSALDGPSPTSGHAVSMTSSAKGHPRIARLGAGTLVVWQLGPAGVVPGYRIVGTRIGSDGTALDTSPTSEGLWISLEPLGPGNEPVYPELAFGGAADLVVSVDRQGETMMVRKLDDTLVYPW